MVIRTRILRNVIRSLLNCGVESQAGRSVTARPATIIVQCVPSLPPKNSPMPHASQFAVHFDHEARSNAVRDIIASTEPHSLRTFTPSQAVLAKSAGVFHWTPEGRRLYDFTSGVLVANLGHNPKRWMNRFTTYLGWNPSVMSSTDDGFFQACVTDRIQCHHRIGSCCQPATDRQPAGQPWRRAS